jgi:pyruvate-formate lyase-activating enzyme
VVNTLHLVDILSLRDLPAAGLFLSLTRRCPLSCAHCSTSSLMNSEEYPEQLFRQFIRTFTKTNRPEVIVLTGGEALLRPSLVQELAEYAHSVGTRVCLFSGMFFANQSKIPLAIERAIFAVDHFTASLDFFHEQQVPRMEVFRVLRDLLERGQHISIQVVGLDGQDPYLAGVTNEIRSHFNDHVPALVGYLGATGRAKEWYKEKQQQSKVSILPNPCTMASWPVVTFDGNIVACCNQTVIDGLAPLHLQLGHTTIDSWAVIRERIETSVVLSALRTFGPEYITDRYSSGEVACDGYCSSCHKLSNNSSIIENLELEMARPSIKFIKEHIENLQRQKRETYGIPEYAHLIKLGYKPV